MDSVKPGLCFGTLTWVCQSHATWADTVRKWRRPDCLRICFPSSRILFFDHGSWVDVACSLRTLFEVEVDNTDPDGNPTYKCTAFVQRSNPVSLKIRDDSFHNMIFKKSLDDLQLEYKMTFGRVWTLIANWARIYAHVTHRRNDRIISNSNGALSKYRYNWCYLADDGYSIAVFIYLTAVLVSVECDPWVLHGELNSEIIGRLISINVTWMRISDMRQYSNFGFITQSKTYCQKFVRTWKDFMVADFKK